MVQGEIRGARASGEFRSFFASMAADRRSHTKISIQIAIILIYCRANDFSSKQTILMLNSYGYQSVIFCQRLFQIYRCLWWNGCRLAKLFAWGVHSCFKCGTWRGWGLGSICAIDESLLRGCQKYNWGRLLRGNRLHLARQNYGRAVAGPWIFGMVLRRDDGSQDLRMFHVLRRNKNITLGPIVLRNLAPGLIFSFSKYQITFFFQSEIGAILLDIFTKVSIIKIFSWTPSA